MILDDIISNKRSELALRKEVQPLSRLEDLVKTAPETISFSQALCRDTGNKNRIIAEIKKASPSKGVIRQDFDPISISRQYEQSGAAAISVLTEQRYFQGSLEYLQLVKHTVALPVLRKDFIIDPYQVYEARAYGADALLLIVAALNGPLLRELISLSESLSLDALVEVHSREELRVALDAGARSIGINNRDLGTFAVSLTTTVELCQEIPDDCIIVSESGINSIADIRILKDAGADAFLIGEALMRAPTPGEKLREFIG